MTAAQKKTNLYISFPAKYVGPSLQRPINLFNYAQINVLKTRTV